jgi:hypothetical protein
LTHDTVGAESEPSAPEWDEEGASDATEPADVTPKKRKTKVTVKEEIQAAHKAMPASGQEEVRIKMTFVLELTFYNSQATFVDGKDKATAHVKGTGTAPVPVVSIRLCGSLIPDSYLIHTNYSPVTQLVLMVERL